MRFNKLSWMVILLPVLLASCSNDIFFNPFKLPKTLNTAEVPGYFNWTLSNKVDLNVELELTGDTVETLDGHFIYLLDSLHHVLTRGIIQNQQTKLYYKIPVDFGKMIVYLPLTGNYKEIYSWASLGTLHMTVAFDDPDSENDLDYLEIEDLESEGSPFKALHETESSVFGNADFSSDFLGTVTSYTKVKSVDGNWYRSIRYHVPVTIEAYEGNNALKLGQSNNGRYAEVTQVIEWSDQGEFEVTFDLISPTSSRVKMKTWLFFYDSRWKKKKQVTVNLNLKNPKGWQNILISGDVPNNTTYIRLVFQDKNTQDPFYIDNVTTNYDSNPDSDGDGINDTDEDYPDDPNKAFNNYFPGSDSYFSLAFEDLWPYKGDYDFNDLVLDCRFNEITNAQNKVVSIAGKVILRAIGGSFHNGFGIAMPINYDQVASISGLTPDGDLINYRSNGTEAGQDKAVIILFEDAYNILINPGYAYVNTRETDKYLDPVEINFEIHLTSPIPATEAGLPPYNPFIFVNGNRGREVHLHGQEPTDLMDRSLLGSGDDVSDTVGGARYYQTATNLPFGMEISSSFDYPVEKAPVDSAYVYFIEWAESGGREKTDWHENKKGYRRSEKVFHK